MYHKEIITIAEAARIKSNFLKHGKLKYILSSMLAGMYVGFGIVLIFTIGGLLSEANVTSLRVIMGISFGIALSLVIMAGSELFTGNNMVMTIGNLEKTVTLSDSITIYFYSFIGNFLGSFLLAYLFILSGLDSGTTMAFILKISNAKISLSWIELLTRGILCNTLVCLALWCSFKMKEETGKLIMIFWCLFAFITTGFEHSVANMTLLSISFLTPGGAGISLGGLIYNIGIVSLGNFIGGAFIVGFSYWYIGNKELTLEDGKK